MISRTTAAPMLNPVCSLPQAGRLFYQALKRVMIAIWCSCSAAAAQIGAPRPNNLVIFSIQAFMTFACR
jgi:hypothetical protein